VRRHHPVVPVSMAVPHTTRQAAKPHRGRSVHHREKVSVTAQALEQSVLESKDKGQLIAIAAALGVKASARNKKSEIIDQILDMTGAGRGNGAGGELPAASAPVATVEASAPAAPAAPTSSTSDESPAPVKPTTAPAPSDDQFDEPKSAWELEIGDGVQESADEPEAEQRQPSGRQQGQPGQSGQQRQAGQAREQREPRENREPRDQGDDGEGRNKRRRRRRKKGGGGGIEAGPQGEDRELIDEESGVPISNEPVKIDGYVDLRDEGYGFLRVNGYLSSKTDSYIPVKLSRQYGLRKGDHVVAMSRPAGRNEKNPAVLEILSVNGRSPDDARRRPRFEDLTALFPDQKLRMEDPADPMNMTARIIDLVCPIGKGQRGIIVSPPKAGKTTVMKTIAASIEKNSPECRLIVLLVDERPEEVTDMRRSIKGEVIASTFDKPSDQHTQIAELAIEKAKRMVEYGEDVVVILDGITRLARAYNLAAPASGRILSGGIDAGALYPPKRFFGAARNVEEGGSLTILATALVETNSRMDEAVFEEFKGTGNMELRLDRRLAERRIYPAIDVDASSTRHEELLYDRKQLQMVWKLRRVLSGLAADGNAAPGLELLVDRLKTFRTNDEFLTEIAKQPGM
jgi:transcription termination factor Rho